MRRKSGFTLVELIVSIIVISICFLSVALMYQEVLRGAFQTRMLSTATALAEEKTEEILSKGYSGVGNVVSTTFPSPFGGYSFQVTVHCVASGNLDTSVDPTATEYKNVQVKVTHSSIADIPLTSLIANYTN